MTGFVNNPRRRKFGVRPSYARFLSYALSWIGPQSTKLLFAELIMHIRPKTSAMSQKATTICFIFHDFPWLGHDSMTFQAWKIGNLISMTFQDLYAPGQQCVDIQTLDLHLNAAKLRCCCRLHTSLEVTPALRGVTVTNTARGAVIFVIPDNTEG